MKKNKKIIKTILVLPLVLGLFFSWFLAKQSQSLAQTASLVATVRINSLEVEVTAPSSVSLGERFKVEATVRNSGETKIKKTKVEIFPDSGLNLKGNSERKMGVILAENSKTASWRLTAEETGSYFIQVEARGIEEESGGLVEASDVSDSIIVKVKNSTSFWSLIFPSPFSFFRLLQYR